MSGPLLALEGAVVRRGGFTLGPVDLEVAAGESVALLGRNGSGKSTVLAAAVGDLPLAAGTSRLGGDDPRALPRREVARRAARLRQGAAPAFALTALELVLHGRWAHGSGLHHAGATDRAAAWRSLERVRADHLADRDVRTLSGGEVQRVLLAKALAQESPLLLLDEPTASLDLAHRVGVGLLAADLARREGRGVVLVTHDLDVAAAACERAVLVLAGRVLAAGPLESVLREDVLREAYGVAVRVDRDPATGRPRVTPAWKQGGAEGDGREAPGAGVARER